MTKRWYEERLGRGFGGAEAESVCLSCVTSEHLRDELRDDLEYWACSFCGVTVDEESDDPIAASFESLMYAIMRGVNFLYLTCSDAGLARDEGEWIGGPVYDSYDVVYSACEGDVSDAVMEAAQRAVDPEDWTDSHISESPLDVALRWGWEAFKKKVMHETRFVFLSAKEMSSDHPDDFTTEEFLLRIEKIIIAHELLTTIPAGHCFWRGRLISSESAIADYRSVAALGSPPSGRASNSRMSPAGVSIFYGSSDVATVVAEIGAHSTLRHAAVGQFATIKELQVLSLIDLPSLPSIYSEETSKQTYYERRFLRSLAADLAKPIALDGREHIEYVPTQVFMEYLRFVPEFAVHGVLFNSAQNGGVNCAIFCGPDGFVDTTAERPRWKDPKDELLRLVPETVHAVRLVTVVDTGPVR